MRKMLHIISMESARSAGLKHYFTGKACRRGGIDERRVSDRKCRCHECMVAASRSASRWQKRTLKDTLDRRRAYRESRSDEISEYMSEYRRENKASIMEASRKHHIDNAGRYRRWAADRHAAKMSRTAGWGRELTDLVMSEAADLCVEREAETGIKWHVDHMIPLRARKASGFHHWSNLQVIPASLNLAKGNKMMYTEPFEWLRDA